MKNAVAILALIFALTTHAEIIGGSTPSPSVTVSGTTAATGSFAHSCQAAFGGTTLFTYGATGSSCVISGTAPSLNVQTSSGYGKWLSVRYTKSGTNQLCGVTSSELVWAKGADRVGGFRGVFRFGIATGGWVATNAIGIGFFDTSVGASQAYNPGANTDAVYLGSESGGTVWNVCSNGGGGAVTCTSTGRSIADNQFLEITFTSTVQGTVDWTFRRIDTTDAGVSGSLSSNIPTTVDLRPAVNMITGTVTTCTIDFNLMGWDVVY